ncbi:terminase [Serratia ureilytica]
MVKAKLFKVTGLTLSDCGDYAQALEHLERAMQLNGHAGVRKEIKNVRAPSSRSRRPPPKEQPRARVRPPRRPSADAHARR